MTDLSTVEDDVDELAGLAAGYDEGASPVPTPEPAKVEVAPAADPVKVVPKEATPAAPPEKPKYARVLQQDWDNTKAMAGKVSNLESQLAKAPTAEKIAQQVLDNLRSQTPAGLTVEISDEDFADLADFPELQKATRSIIEKIFKKANVKGTGPAAPPSTPPAQSVDVNAEVEKVLLKREEDALARTYPDWSDIVGRPPSADASVPDGNPFRAWLGKQSAAYQKAVNETNSPADVQEAIASFKASQKGAPPDRAAARRAVIESAVQPSGDGQAPPPKQPKSVTDAFNEGYRDG